MASGGLASLASCAVLLIAGKRELDDPAAPLNGPSQWIWGTPAAYRGGFDVRHTMVGYAIHHVASVFWALLYERARPPGNALPAAVVTSGVACVVDYCCTPQRFTPGFEKRLSRGALFGVYAAFALGLAAAHLSKRD